MKRAKPKKPPQKEPSPKTNKSPKAKARKAPADGEIQDHRRRQQSIAQILDHMFGELAGCKSQLWDQRAYLLIVGMVYERLALKEGEISMKELAALARILAEQRRSRSPGGKRRGGRSAGRSGKSTLPESFGEVVQQVYGTAVKMKSSA